MKKFIKKQWTVSSKYDIINGFNMKPGFLYSIDIETGKLVDIVTSVSNDMEYITVFHKTNDNEFERHFYYYKNVDKHILNKIYAYINEMEDKKTFYPYPSKSHCYKMAMDFIEKKICPYGTYEEEFQAYTDGTPPVIKVYAKFPNKVKELIYKKTKGEVFSHWEDPLLIEIDEELKQKYEEKYNPPHCW